jgi:hypothetical protein
MEEQTNFDVISIWDNLMLIHTSDLLLIYLLEMSIFKFLLMMEQLQC